MIPLATSLFNKNGNRLFQIGFDSNRLVFPMPLKYVSSWIGGACAVELAMPGCWAPAASEKTGQLRLHNWLGTYTADFRQVESLWPEQTDQVFLSRQYLAAQANALPDGLRPRFLVLEDETGPFAWLALQLVDFRALDHIREESVWQSQWKRLLGRLAQFRLLICGNLFMLGENGWLLRPGWQGKDSFTRSLGPILRTLARRDSAQVVVCKDFKNKWAYRERGLLHALHFQPNMVLNIQDSWHSFEDYQQAMSSKYRIRQKRAFKKADGLIFKPLNIEEIEAWSEHIASLYQEVVLASGFAMAMVEAPYFPCLKRALGEKYRLTGVFEGEELKGFYSTIRNGEYLEANFIGFSPACNTEHQLYLNMLYRMVEESILTGAKRLVLSRTALEIKSSIGAVAEPAYVYMAHVNPLLNGLVPLSVGLLEPVERWEPRHPFGKAE